MELNHLKYFYEVAKRGSFTGASKTLRVSQPSISKIVQLLEEREGVKLFNRNKKGDNRSN
jgi:DNA-binding transcriptional LysR family regulator